VRRLDLTREQLIALGAVLCLMMGCVLLVGYSLTRQAGAAEELAATGGADTAGPCLCKRRGLGIG